RRGADAAGAPGLAPHPVRAPGLGVGVPLRPRALVRAPHRSRPRSGGERAGRRTISPRGPRSEPARNVSSMHTLPDENLVAAYLDRGDQRAFTALVERHQERIFGYLMGM